MSDKEWYELPRPLGAAKLVALRDELRKMNPGRGDFSAHVRRHLQRRVLSDDG
jgi:hypothetical protein